MLGLVIFMVVLVCSGGLAEILLTVVVFVILVVVFLAAELDRARTGLGLFAFFETTDLERFFFVINFTVFVGV